MPNGEQAVKAITKAALKALFSIGVHSQTYIDRFIVSFSEELEKEWLKLNDTPPAEAANSPKTADDRGERDIGALVENDMIQKALRGAGITTINQLLTRMQQESLTKIKGIGEKSENEIREKVAQWNKLQS